ncbi:MAG TPA: hypothetical protein PLV92_04695 [Pirellulaceae bacterium]|nr:hypothetical protein [Pirellulaceae bacterium]
MIGLRARFTETLTVKRTTSHTDAGDPVRATTFTCRARIERSTVEQGDDTGRAVDARHRVFADAEIQQGDLLFFPEDDTGNDDTGHRVIQVDEKRRLGGDVLMWSVLT